MPTISSNGIKLYYQEAGTGFPLLLLHGLGSQGKDWELQLPVFAQRYRTIAPDLRGHGQSERPPGPYSVHQMARDVMGLMAELGIATAHVVGLSMGGMIAFQMALDWPECVRSLVVVNSAPSLVPRSAAQWLRIQQRLLLAHVFGPARTGRFLSRRLFPKEDQKDMRAQLIERWAGNDKQAYLAAIHALVGWSVTDRLSAIQCPTLVITGDRDYTPPEYKREYTALIPEAQMEIFEDSGHATPIDQANHFNNRVLEFLAGCDAPLERNQASQEEV